MEPVNFPKDKKVYLFEIDDVIYDKKDYLLQVYYLFAQFMEFTLSQTLSAEMVAFMKETLLQKGEDEVFEQTAEEFKLERKYKENFERLHVNAHLPLKLFLFDNIKQLFHELSAENKQIAILTKGNPALQLNKLRHIDWEGYDKKLKVYFIDELNFRNIEPFSYIASENNVNVSDLHFVETFLK